LLTGFAPSIAWLFLGRAVAGIAGAVYVPANAFVADVTPPEQRARAFGLVGSAFGLGFIIGPGIGGLLGELGPRAPFFAAGGLAIINFFFGIFVLPESLPLERRRTFSWRRANPLGAALAFRKYPSVFVYAFIVMIFFIGNNVYPSTWAFFTSARFGWSSGMIGLSLVATGVAMALVQAVLVGYAVKRFGESRTALAGLAIAAVTAFTYAFVPEAWMIFVVTVLGAPQAVTYPALNALLSRQVPLNAQGELQGAVASVMSIANIVGPYVMTQSFAYFTAPTAPIHFPGAPFLVAAMLSITGMLVLVVRFARSPAPVVTVSTE
jgi:MFS transporter, DHA1 family, tetracycline resistance protein